MIFVCQVPGGTSAMNFISLPLKLSSVSSGGEQMLKEKEGLEKQLL